MPYSNIWTERAKAQGLFTVPLEKVFLGQSIRGQSKTEPSHELQVLARYIVCVYLPMAIQIKHKWDSVHAARHLAEELRRQRKYTTGAELTVVQDSVARNALMGHPESITMVMLGDDNEQVRTAAVRTIIAARQRNTGSVLASGQSTVASEEEQPSVGTSKQMEKKLPRKRPNERTRCRSGGADVRRYQVLPSEVNRSAATYQELHRGMEAMMQAENIEPPFLRSFSMEQVMELSGSPLRTGIPCHTQSTERAVKRTTESVSNVCGADRQDGKALNKIASRRRAHE